MDILTGEHIAQDKIGGLIAGWAIRSEDGSEIKCPPIPPLAKDNANFVGDPVAVVFAETLDEAKTAAELVKVDYKVLKAVTSLADTMKSDAIHEGIDKNLCYDWLLGDRQKVKEAFDKADKIIKLDITNNRLIPNAMEPRACVIDYNTASEEITCYTTSQNPHLSRLIMSAFGGVAPENKLRVVAPDVGGGFGSKINLYNEEEIDKLGYQWESSLVIGVDYYLYEKQYWVHGWLSVMPYSKGLTDYSFTYEKGDIDFDIGLVAGYKFNRNIGIFGEGRYLKYFGIDAYELKAGINVTIF